MLIGVVHGLQTPNESINQRNIKIWADVAAKYALAMPKNLGVGVDFWAFVVRGVVDTIYF